MSAPTTETAWYVEGVPLNTFAYNITTMGGGRMAPPAFRGSDAVVPGRPGGVYQPRTPDSRTIELAMWVQGSNEDGSVPAPGTTLRQQFDANWRKLVQMFWSPRKQKKLTKRFYISQQSILDAGLGLDDFEISGDWVIIEATALFTFGGGLAPNIEHEGHGSFTVDLFLTDPYFYGPTITNTFRLGQASATQTLHVLGDDRTSAIRAKFTGPIAQPRFTNLDGDTTLYVEYGTTVAQGETADIDVAQFSAIHTPTAGAYRSTGYVRHVGDAFWLYLNPGPQRVALTADGGTGYATFTYQSLWF